MENTKNKISTRRLITKTLKLWLFSAFRFRWYLPGNPEITAEEVVELMETENPPFLLDLRDLKEFDGTGKNKLEQLGHIPSSYSIPFFQVPSRSNEIPKDRDIVTICPGGGASLVVVDLLVNSGFEKGKVKSLKKGIKGWHKQGFPLEKSDKHNDSKYKLNDHLKNDFLKTHQTLDEKAIDNITETLDTRGFICPEPVLKTRKLIRKMDIGQTLEVLATDPGSYSDIPAWVIHSGQQLVLAEKKSSGIYRYIIKRNK